MDDFYIGKYEVTVGEFREFVKKTGYRTDAENGDGCYYYTEGEWEKGSSKYWDNPGFSQTDSNPVVCVSWNDANEFVNWKSRTTGDKYRLPTEGEWEYAARSGGKKEKWAGTGDENELKDYAWFESNSGKKTHPVGELKSNGFGLYDMSGNVWELVRDWYDSDYYKNSPKDNPKGPSSGSNRMHRGGGWNNKASFFRSTYRGSGPLDGRFGAMGFRLVRTK